MEELAANKVLALFDRAEARDFLDLVALTRRFELRSLLALASEKDTGLDLEGFRDALGSFERFTSADFGASVPEYEHLRATVARSRDDLARGQRREPPELGLWGCESVRFLSVSRTSRRGYADPRLFAGTALILTDRPARGATDRHAPTRWSRETVGA